MHDWQLVKHRTAADDGAVWRSTDGRLYKRTGGPDVAAEAAHLHDLYGLGYPVPAVIEHGVEDGGHYYVEESVGDQSLNDAALADTETHGHVGDELVDTIAAVSTRLLGAQASTPLPTAGARQVRDFVDRAGFTTNVFAENPDLDTLRVHAALGKAVSRLAELPMCRSHLDYGLPNAFPGGVIDWQHHGTAPVGYDVYPMLEIIPFKGGNRGYEFTDDQRATYLAALDQAATERLGRPLSGYLGEFLLIKCFFFLALMRPTDPTRVDKHTKWRYRRHLLETGIDQYESTGTIDTGAFPSLRAYTDRHAAARGPRP